MSRLVAVLVALARRLSTQDVPYAVIGGFANLQWGRPRVTEDLDVSVSLDETALPEFLAALAPEFRARPADPVAFARETAVVPLESADGVRIDVVLARLAFEEEAIRRGVEVSLEGNPIRFVTAEDLILYKIVSERPRDREDVEGIVRRQAGRIDLEYLRPRIITLSLGLQRPNLVTEFEQLIRGAK